MAARVAKIEKIPIITIFVMSTSEKDSFARAMKWLYILQLSTKTTMVATVMTVSLSHVRSGASCMSLAFAVILVAKKMPHSSNQQ